MVDEYDPFHLSSGLKDDYDGIIKEAYFAPSEYGTNLQLVIVDEETGEEDQKRYSLGASWETFDAGATVEHPTAKWFNQNSAVGELVAAMLATDAEPVVRQRSKEFGGKGPMASGVYKGLRFHWEIDSRTITMKDRETQKDKVITVNRLVPTKFLGEGNPDGDTIKAPVDNSVLNGLGADTQAKMSGLASQMGYQDWIDAVMDLPGVGDAPNIASKLNEALYTSLKG